MQLCDIILRHSQETILCVCYTNHALDQFLEALLDKGITDIVRIGSRSRSDRMEQYNMRQLVKQQQGRLSRVEGRRMYNVIEEVKNVEAEAARLGGLLAGMASLQQLEEWEEAQQQQEKKRRNQGKAAKPQHQQQRGKQNTDAPPFEEWQKAIGSFLESWYPSLWEQLRVPAEFPKGADYLWEEWRAGARGRGVVDRWIKKRREKGQSVDRRQDGSATSGFGQEGLSGMGGDIWKLPREARAEMVCSWRRELCGEWAAQLAEQLETGNKLQQEMWGLHDSAYEKVLAGARVIGCTTTGAAMVKSLLSSAKVAPG